LTAYISIKEISRKTLTYSSINKSVGMFYRQRILVIDSKYNNDDGLSTGRMCQAGTRSILGRCNRERWIRSKELAQRLKYRKNVPGRHQKYFGKMQ
jgi:hypothetical protein